MQKKCKLCNLPENYTNIWFNEEGVCNYCIHKYDKVSYPGLDVLKAKIDGILSLYDSNRKYDCVVGCSGGRDSSYLLYYAKEVLKLNVLAVSLDHDFMPPQTKKNIITLCDKLGVDLKFITNKYLNKSSRKCVKHWANKPDIAMCATFCSGCRYGIKRIIPRFARENNIPILLVGDTPYEAIDYRVNLLCDGKEVNKKNKIKGYSKRILQNPSYLLSPSSMYTQFRDFISCESNDKNEFPVKIAPFAFVKWEKNKVLPKIQELGWKYDESLNSSWRSDCYVNILRQFFYKKVLGYNDLDVYYSKLIRNGEIDIKKAISLIEKEGQYDENVVREIFKKYYNVDYDKVCKKLKYSEDDSNE